MREIKCVVIGDGFVDKTSLLITFTQKYFPCYIPNVFDDNFSTTIRVSDEDIRVNLQDTSGQQDYWIRHFGRQIFANTNVFVVCFAVDSRASFESVETWAYEIQQLCPGVPIILLATKIDLRCDDIDDKTKISRAEGIRKCKLIGAVKYLQCSAKLEYGVEEIFLEAYRLVLHPPKSKAKKKCNIV